MPPNVANIPRLPVNGASRALEPIPSAARKRLRVVIIDNFDSYTFNVYQLFCGVLEHSPVVIRNNQMGWAEFETRVLPHIDAIVLSPGPGTPEHPQDIGLCGDVLRYPGPIPVFGVCLGHQAMGLQCGGRVERAPEVMHGRLSPIEHLGTGLFVNVPLHFLAVRYHSLIVHEDLPSDLITTAWVRDNHTGRRLVMALEHRTKPWHGVQFHPESICSEYGHQMAINFCDLALAARPRKPYLLEPYHALSEHISVVPTHVPHSITPAHTSDVHQCHVAAVAWCDPEMAFDTLFAASKQSVWLDSAHVEGETRWSYMGERSATGFSLTYSLHNGQVAVQHGDGQCETRSVASFFDFLQTVYLEHQIPWTAIQQHGVNLSDDDLPQFLGGLVGYIGYGLKAETLNMPAVASTSTVPDATFVFLDRALCFDHFHRRVVLVALGPHEPALTWIRDTAAALDAARRRAMPVSATQPASPAARPPVDQFFTPDLPRAPYLAAIQRSNDLIDAGETYEVCMTTQFRCPYDPARVDPWSLYRSVRRRNPAPYGAYLRFAASSGVPAHWIVCSSPERFLRVDREHVITMKPIKGTARRGKTQKEDEAIRAALEANDKDRAENLMIVDLIRNDLNLVSTTGSVCVPKLMHVESYETLHQLVSTIQGDLDPNLTAVDALRHTFPPGSMTGAPKLRTVQLLEDQLESSPRGIYSGCIGFLSAVGGASHFNVVIRTAIGDETAKSISIGAGGAIVALSDPADEWDEVVLKLQSVGGAVADFVTEASR
ncbi:aminodeoxychorismate synthase [Allomyces macrogynus ATCC 38327]|uniref:aminodeoxychorismate synthase n=1 Tax=Allomyces macrogynus (strain ATCC 38327) TaxID=578462 RepID=A0A0L0S8E5_ALLM3|nr:aminodeoxychorismate synthase [Allomyces macrogynus ATCC 38327]|eukprot:KNE58639.1 aminodeoxychorismate synthase [Allomyces macrogynus ATCC 38327]